MKRMLDTSAYVALKRGEPRTVAAIREAKVILMPLIVIGELMFGFRNGRRFDDNRADLEAFVAASVVKLALPTWTTADRFGRIAASLRRAGTPIPTNDVWIAAQAFETGAELLTHDQHFTRVPGLVAQIFS